MRIAGVWKDGTPNAYYRAVLPLRELGRRGHRVEQVDGDVLWRAAEHGGPFDALLLQQFFTPEDLVLVQRLRERGIAVLWDTDDDISEAPRHNRHYSGMRGRRKRREHFEQTIEIASAAHVMTTTTEHLADVYRGHGVPHVVAIDNHVATRDARRRRRRHAGVVIGMTTAGEHESDVKKLGIGKAVERILDEHANARVISIGVDLGVRGPRCRHFRGVPIDQLLDHESEFDIGLAPLLDTPFNRARSNVKLKEYAAVGASWLASPVGPYRDLGEEQGGQLVDAGGWYEAIDALLRSPALRAARAERARAWVQTQTIEAGGAAWEAACRMAVARARGEGRPSKAVRSAGR